MTTSELSSGVIEAVKDKKIKITYVDQTDSILKEFFGYIIEYAYTADKNPILMVIWVSENKMANKNDCQPIYAREISGIGEMK